MSERMKRNLLCCGFGWFLGGMSMFDHVMAVLFLATFAIRVYLFTE